MKRSILFRIFVGYVIVIVAMVGLTLLLSLRTVRNYHLEVQRASLRSVAMALEPTFSRALGEGRLEALDTLAKELGRYTNSRITIIDPAGTVLADSWHNPEEMDNHRTRPEIMRALAGETGTSLRYSDTVQEEFLYVAIPFQGEGGIKGALRVSVTLRSVNDTLRGLRNEIIAIASVVLAISLLAAFFFSRSLSRPINELSAASRKVASGDFDARVLLSGRGELKSLADNFNYMTEQIRTLFDELSQRGEELSSIVGSIQDGLLVLDRDGRIVLSNAGFQEIVGEESVNGKHYWEVMRVPQLDELVRTVTKEKAGQVQEVPFKEKTYICSGAYLSSREGSVVLLHDITDMKDVERVKKDFIVNLSHELRTPLTAIKGFLETLQDEVTVEGRHYLGIVRQHADRLTNIVEDLLVLSELEDSSTGLELGVVDLKRLVEDVVPVFGQKIRAKGLQLTIDAPDGGPVVAGDGFKLEQVFMNLIANAVKYTDEGWIKVTLRQDAANAVITVEDTGAGISEEHLPRIFERFYVVDKSRSKKVGGTGLGLSIVKHIVLLHNGAVDVRSAPGRGTTFIITLPLSQTS